LAVPALYVALGDSMSIDDYAGGPGCGAASLLYRNRDGDFPAWAGRDLASLGFDSHVLARDGATSTGVLRTQAPLITAPPSLVTISMGGNDIMQWYGDTGGAYAAVASVAAAAEALLTLLRQGGADQVVVTTVYDPSDGTGEVAGAEGLLAPWPEGPAVVTALNQALTEAAQRHGAIVADVHGAFAGHGAAAGDPAQPLARPTTVDLWYCGVIEPNAWGAHHIRATWWHALQAAGWRPPA
jgi:lysophospholipase L1-like esterase